MFSYLVLFQIKGSIISCELPPFQVLVTEFNMSLTGSFTSFFRDFELHFKFHSFHSMGFLTAPEKSVI